jgi:hypothetical protein
MNQDQVVTSAQADPASAGDLHAYAGDDPVTFTDLSGHCFLVCLSSVVNVAKKYGGAIVHTAKRVVAKTVAVARPVVRAVRHVASVAVARVSDAYHAAVTYAVRAVKAVARSAPVQGIKACGNP